jgi:hypothetical protein
MVAKVKIPGWPEGLGGVMPGFGNPMGDSALSQSFAGGLDFVKSLWGGLPTSMPGLVVPTIDVEELDRRIKDLKAVESWLEVNANMLRATIQALEVQRNTVATLQTLGGNFSGGASEILKAMGNAAQAVTTRPSPPPRAAASPHASATAPAAAPHARSKSAPVDKSKAGTSAKAAAKSGAKSSSTAASAAGTMQGAGTAWLEYLQNQFNQVALAALSPSKGTSVKQPPAPPKSASPPKRGARRRS